MKISFFYECGEIKEIGMGHKYRCRILSKEMERRGHTTDIVENKILFSDTDVLVIDHLFDQENLIHRAQKEKIKVLLIDGTKENARQANESVSAIYNQYANHTGIKYMCFPTAGKVGWYNTDNRSNTVFVGMGGYDHRNLAEYIVDILADLGLNAIVARSINHTFSRTNMEYYEEDCYYDPMNECLFGITAGGLTLFQCLFYGLPAVSIPQYEHQKDIIYMLSECCLEADKFSLKRQTQRLLKSSYLRAKLSVFGPNMIDGKAVYRICDLIEGLDV